MAKPIAILLIYHNESSWFAFRAAAKCARAQFSSLLLANLWGVLLLRSGTRVYSNLQQLVIMGDLLTC